MSLFGRIPHLCELSLCHLWLTFLPVRQTIFIESTALNAPESSTALLPIWGV